MQHREADDLIESELRQQYLLLVEAEATAHIGIWQWEVNNPNVKWSPELYRIYGMPEEYSPSYEGYLEKVHPEDREKVRLSIEGALRHNKSFTQNERVLRPDGSVRDLHTWGHTVLDESGKLKGLIGVCQDITEQKEAERKLRQSEHRYRSIVEGAEEGIWLIDQGGITILTNLKMCRILGYEAGEMEGKSVFLFMDEAYRAKAKQQLYKRRQGIRERFEFEFRHKDGSRVWTTISANPLYDDTGKYSGALGIVNDVTWQKRTKILLTAQRDIFDLLASGSSLKGALNIILEAAEKLIEGVIGSVLLLDDEGKRLLTGAAPRLPEEYNKSIHGASIGPTAGSCGTAAFRGELVIVEDIETDPLWKDYKELARPYGLKACWSCPIFSRDCKVLGTFAMYFKEVKRPKDSEIKLVKDAAGVAALAIQHIKAREALAKAIQLRDDFIAIASHELRTPLTPLKLQAQFISQYLAESQLLGPQKEKELRILADGLNKQVNRLLDLSEDLLNTARIGAGKLELKRQKCDLNEIVRDVLLLHNNEIKRGKCAIEMVGDQPIIGNWDKSQIERVVINLLSNAIKFGREKPITLKTNVDSGFAFLSIIDNGIGIAKEDLKRLFQRFERVVSAKNYGGLGLGLYLARQVVKAHGGDIYCESTLGQGTTFTVKLPF